MRVEAAGARARAVARRRWPVFVIGLVLLTVIVAIGNAAGPYLFRVATLQSEIATQVRVTTGLMLSADGAMRFDLLPSPRLKMSGVHISDPSGTVTITARALRGEVRLLPLLVGRIELAAATLEKPRLAIDLDGRPMPPDSLLGRAMHARGDTDPGDRRLGAVALSGGTVSFRSRTRHLPPRDRCRCDDRLARSRIARDADGHRPHRRDRSRDRRLCRISGRPDAWRTIRGNAAAALRTARHDGEWRGRRHDQAELQGTRRRHCALPRRPGHAARRPVRPARSFRGARSRQRHRPRDGSRGRRRARSAEPAPHGRRQQLRGHISLPWNRHAAAVGYIGGGSPDAAALLRGPAHTARPGPGLVARRHRLSDGAGRAPARRANFRVAPRDAAVPRGRCRAVRHDAGRSHRDRPQRRQGLWRHTEGATVGRRLGGVEPAGRRFARRGRCRRARLGPVRPAGRGGQPSGSGSFETAGGDVAALVGHLGGWARGTATDGDLSGADLGLGLRALARSRPAEATSALDGGRTPFQTLTFDLRLADGIATLGEASMHGRDAMVSASGSIDLGRRALDLHAVAATPEVATSGPRAHLPLEIGGSFDQPSVRAQAIGEPARD